MKASTRRIPKKSTPCQSRRLPTSMPSSSGTSYLAKGSSALLLIQFNRVKPYMGKVSPARRALKPLGPKALSLIPNLAQRANM